MGNTCGKPKVVGFLLVLSHDENSSAFCVRTDNVIFVSGQSHGRGGGESCCSQLCCNITVTVVIIQSGGTLAVIICKCLRFVPNFVLLIVAATAAGCHGNKI